MNSKFSLPLFKENLKRFWPISAVGFIIYFLSGPFTLMSQHYDSWSSYEVRWAVGSQNIAYIMLDVVLGCVAAVTVFAYLHKSNSAAAVHAMPFSRLSLFITNYASGFAIAFIPRVLNTLVLLVIRKDFFTNSYTYPEGIEVPVQTNIFTVSGILEYFGIGFVCVLFVFAIAVLASMVSGNTVIAMLTAPTMNFILPLFVISLLFYGEIFLYGFTSDGGLAEISLKLSPVLLVMRNDLIYDNEMFGIKWAVIYIIAAVAISIAAFLFYKKRKLERAGDAYVFNFIKYIVCFFFVYFAATFFGAIFEEKMYIGMAFGIIIGFIIGWMIANKSFRIFNLDSLKALAIYAVIIAAIVAGFRFDITGYAKRSPALGSIESVDITGSINYYYADSWQQQTFKDEENIRHLIALQKELAASKGSFDDDLENDSWVYLALAYQMKNGKIMRRSYSPVPVSFFEKSEDLKAVFESAEYKASYDYIKDIRPRSIEIRNEWSGYGIRINDRNEMNELLDVIYRDSQNQRYEDLLYGREEFISINVETSKRLEYDDTAYEVENFDISQRNAAVIEWLRAKGYLDELLSSVDDGFIVITKDPSGFYDNEIYYRIQNTADKGIIPESGEGYYVISDPRTMHDIALNISYGIPGLSAMDQSRIYWGVYWQNQDRYNGWESGYYYDARSFNIFIDDLPADLLADINRYLD